MRKSPPRIYSGVESGFPQRLRATRISCRGRLGPDWRSSVPARTATRPRRLSSCSCPLSAFSSRGCFAFGLLPLCPRFCWSERRSDLSSTSARRRRSSVAFCAAMPRCRSRSTAFPVTIPRRAEPGDIRRFRRDGGCRRCCISARRLRDKRRPEVPARRLRWRNESPARRA